SMVDGRWYATATALGDGRIMAFSGLSLSGGTNNTVEIYDLRNAEAGWTSPVAAPFSPPPVSAHATAAKRLRLLHRPGHRAERQRLALRPGVQDVDGVGPDDPRPRLRLGCPLAALAAELHAAGDELWRRQSGHEHDGDHRPLRGLAELDARTQYVHGPHPD